jgi:hypothetical protein
VVFHYNNITRYKSIRLIIAEQSFIISHTKLKHPKSDAGSFLLTSATSRALGSKNSHHQEIKKI